MNESRKIGGLYKSVDENGTIYRQHYFLNSQDKATWEAALYYKAAGHLQPYYGPSNSYIHEFDFTPIGDHWILKITFYDNGYKNRRYSFTIGANEIVKNLELTEMYMDPAWWGAVEVTSATETTNLADWREANPDKSTYSLIMAKFLNVYGNPVCQHDYMFLNATTSDKGTPDFTLCPFAGINTNNYTTYFPVSWIGRVCETWLYTVSYAVRSDLYAFQDVITFKGVNGNWGSGCAPEYSSWASAGNWLAVSSNMQWKAINEGGFFYHRITRKMKKAPTLTNSNNLDVTLKWDASKNGGTWSW